MAQPSTYLDDVRMSAVSVAVILRDIGAPQERFNTPPYMSRRFADLLIRVHSLEQLAVLVAQHPRDAAAFVMTALHVIRDMEAGEWVFQRPLDASEITAAGHAMISFLDEVERIYPEGLTQYDH